MRIRRSCSSIFGALLLVAVLAFPAGAATESESGSLACSYGYVGLLKAVAYRDVDGYSVGGVNPFAYAWGSYSKRTYYIAGSISGHWFAESQTDLDTAATYASCA